MNTKYWLKHWEEKSMLEDDIIVSGRSSKDIKEYLYDMADTCKKLRLKKEDRLLNIGCSNGIMEILFSSWVKSIVGIDFSMGMIKKARENNKKNKNVKFFKGDMLDLGCLKEKFDKVLCKSVIQYLGSIDDVKKALMEISKAAEKGAIILISANPDIGKLEEYIAGYDRLSLKKEEIEEKKKKTRLALWTDPCDMKKMAELMGYKADIMPMHPSVWHSWYMYDLVLKKI